MIRRELRKFRCKNGLVAKGIIYGPDADDANPLGIVYLPGSVLGSTAVHRLGIDICAYLAGKGFKSFIFDHTKIGESEGEYPEGSSDRLNKEVVIEGALVGDTHEAIDCFIDSADLKKVILIGHCGGGLTALYTAAYSGKVAGIMLISTPVLWEGGPDFAASEGAVREYSTLYKNRLMSVESWKKLLSGRSDYSLLYKFIRNKAMKLIVKDGAGKKLMKRYKESVDRARTGKTVVFLMGDKDPGLDDFKYFANKYLKPGEYSILQNTSHGFVSREGMNKLYDEINKFTGSFN